MKETDTTYWFHKTGIYKIEGPIEAPNYGRNEGKAFEIELLREEDGLLVAAGPDTVTWHAYTRNHVNALKSGIKYFTGSDYKVDLEEFSSCFIRLEEGVQNAS